MAENVYDQFTPKRGQGQTSNPYDQFTPASATAAEPEQDVGFTGAVARGFRRSLPETKSLLYGAGAAVADAVGADGLRDRALNNYRRIQSEEVAPLQGTATFRRSLSGQDSIGEWAGDVIGNFAGQALQSAAAGAAGAAIGAGGGSVVPGAGTAVGGVTGAVGGLVARGAAKKLVTEAAEKLIANQVAKGVAREAAEAAGKQLVQRRLQQVGGAALASYGLNAAQEAGISYTGRVEDAEAAGEQLGSGDALRALGAGAVAGAVDTAAEGIGVGRLLRGASASPRITRRLLAGTAAGAVTEGATEAAQGAIERWGAQRDLTSAEAIDDYIENAAAGALGGGVMGAGGGVRRRTLPSGAPVPDASNGPLSRAVSNAADTGALDRAAAAQAAQTQAEQSTEAGKPQAQTTAQRSAEVPVEAPAESPVVQNLRRQQPVPWIDAETGEVRVPTDDEVKLEINRYLDEQSAAGLKRSVKRGELVNALGLDQIGRSALERNTIIGQALNDRKQAESAPAQAQTQQESQQAQPLALPLDEPAAVVEGSAEEPAAAAPVRGSEAARLRRMIDRTGTPYFVPEGDAERAEEAAPATQEVAIANEPAGDGDALIPAAAPAQASAIAPETSSASSNALPAEDAGAQSAPQSLPPVDAAAASARPEGQPALASTVGDTGSMPSAQPAPAATPLQVAANDAATSPTNDRAEPTEAQKEAGNYKKGHARVAGLDISIENPAGTSRRPEWPPLANHYGYFKGTVGRDKDHVDVFLTDNAEDASRPVFVVDQIDPKTGKFDEHKVIMGAADEAEARATYQANYSADWQGLGGIKQMTLDQFKTWVKDPKKTNRRATRAPAAAPAAAAPAAATPVAPASSVSAPPPTLPAPAIAPAPAVTPAPLSAAQKRAETQARADAVFSQNRKAIVDKDLRKGDTVTWTTGDQTFTGDILSLGDKDQAVIAVGVPGSRGVADYHIGASHLTKVDGTAPKGITKAAAQARADGAQRMAAPSTSPEPVVRIRGGKPAYVPAARGTLEAYFQPGRVINGYGGKDRVISLDWKDEGWSVRVIRVDANGNPAKDERERTHSTLPSTRELHAVLGEPTKASPKKPASGTKRAAAVHAPKPSPAKTAVASDDAGEELWYNRRNRLGAGLKWSDIEGLNATLRAKETVKPKIWPRPDYETLVNDGLPPVLARVVKDVYDSISAKPASRGAATDEQMKTYVDGLQKVRDAVFSFVRALDTESFRRALELDDGVTISRHLAEHSLLNDVFPGEPRQRFSGNKANNDLALVMGGRKLVNALQITRADIKSAQRAVDGGWPTPQEAWQKSYVVHVAPAGTKVLRKGEQVTLETAEYFISKKGYRSAVADGFATREAAVERARELANKNRRSGTQMAEEAIELDRAVRTGTPRREAGEDVSSERLMQTFGFRGVNFGNWMKGNRNAAERQLHLNHAFDSFADLADLLGVPARALSLDGMLGIAFGAQGQGASGGAAHFVPGVNEINLTREHGVGSLAHEWSHALDHYFAVQAGEQHAKRSDPFLTHVLDGGPRPQSQTIRPEIVSAFGDIVRAMKKRNLTPEELAARETMLASSTERGVNAEITSFRRMLEARAKPAEKERALVEFDALADRIRAGDLGEGYVEGKTYNTTFRPVMAQVRSLFKEATGRTPSLEEFRRFASWADSMAFSRTQKQDTQQHLPQTAPSSYLTEARKLDRAGGKTSTYWTLPTELFARAFQSYVLDRLATGGARNDYLTRPQMTAEQRQRLLDSPLAALVEDGDRYPRGEERERINGAFDTLVGSLQTRETERGIALFSKDSDAVAPVQAARAEGDAESLWREADRFYRQELQGSQVDGPDGPVRFANTGRTKALATGRRNALRMGVARQLGELAKVARIYAEAPDRVGDRGISYAYAVAPVEVDGKVYAVRMLYRQTREQPGSRGFYTFEGFEMSEPGAMDRGRRSEDQLDRRGSPGSGYTVAQLEAALNNPRAFSRTATPKAPPAGRGLSLARAQELKGQLTAKWGDNAPNVVLVTDAEGFPNSAKVDPDYQRGEGFYDGRPTVWINLGRIRTEARFAQVLAHEAIGHYGVERVVGASEWAGIVDSIERLDREGTARGQVRKILAEVHQKQPGLSRENFAREVIAFMAEKGIRNSWVNRVIAAVRRYLRQIMPTLRWRETDVLQLLSAADGFLRRGRDAAARSAMVQSYAFSADGEPTMADVEEVSLDSAFVAGLSPAERRSGPMTELARALWADLGTDSPFFREWFGDSKVVDKSGQPLKVYHGTAADFDAFDPQRAGKSTNHTTAHLGIFFDANRSKAEHYARVASNDVPADQRVIETYLSIRNPYVMPQAEFVAVEGREESLALRARLEREGYDGIQLPSEGQWIAFGTGQIKATDNRGTFDRTEPRMLFSKAAADPASVIDDIEAVMEGTRADAKLVQRARAALAQMTPKGLGDLVRRVKDSSRPTWLGALTTRHLTELGTDYFGNMRLYSDYLSEMGADRNQLAAEGEATAEAARKWAGKNRAESQQLFRLMHDATIQGIDPAEGYQPLQFRYGGQLRDATKANVKEALTAIREQMRGRGGDNKTDLLNEAKQLRAMPAREQQRKRAYPSLVERWNQLSPEAQDHYRQMRDLYQKRSGQVEEALVARINDTDVPDSHKRKIITTIRQQFESARLQGVYFPLQRFGRYFVAAERDGTPSFLMFERLDQLERAVKDLRARGFTIKAQGLKSDGKAKDAPSGTFVADVIQTLDKAGVSNVTQDQIYQLYLQALPELSMRKHSIHRQSVPGFDPDAVRAFAYNMHHGAHQLAKLRYAHKLQDVIDLLRKGQEDRRREAGADTRSIAAGDAILSELARRHEWITNPQDSALTNLISSFGFVYYLGLTPAAALVNLTQTALVSYPYLASRFGAVKAMNYLLAAGRQSGTTLGDIQKRLTDPDEVRAHQVLQAMGALDKTQAHNLAGIAEGGMQGYNPAWARAMEIIGWGFHKTEVINRETTGIAAFRLARAEGKGFDEAVRIAADAINDTHFDYTNANRARFMQSGTAKVLLMFRQYSLNMTWHLGRMLWNATKGEAPEVRKIARRNLAGIVGMSALFSGALGLPLMGVTLGVLNSVASSFGDDDEPWDAETEFRAFLAGMLGQAAAETILGGAVNQITGADIGSRVSLSQLWFRDADRELEGRGAYYNLLEQAAGPMGGVLKNALVGKQLIDDGHLMRGVETVLPKSMKDVLKAGRYATQGANNLRGDALVEDLNPLQVLLQLNGFTPSELAERYDRNRSLKNYEQHILDRRQHLVGAFAMANRLGDDAAKRDVVSAIGQFNASNPEVAITPASIRRSLLQRARYSAEAEGGIMLNQKLAPRLREAVDG